MTIALQPPTAVFVKSEQGSKTADPHRARLGHKAYRGMAPRLALSVWFSPCGIFMVPSFASPWKLPPQSSPFTQHKPNHVIKTVKYRLWIKLQVCSLCVYRRHRVNSELPHPMDPHIRVRVCVSWTVLLQQLIYDWPIATKFPRQWFHQDEPGTHPWTK